MASDAFKALTVTYQAGERIVSAGERGACMFVVQSGTVRLAARPEDPDDPPSEIARLEKGDFFGESALLEGQPYRTMAEAVTDCEIVEIGASTFERMLRGNPEIAVRLLRKLAHRVERLERRVLDLTATAHGDGAARTTERRSRTDAARARGRLVVESGDGVFPMCGTELLIGRYDPVTEIQPEIDLTAVDTKRSVSRRHARLEYKDGRWYLSEEVGVLNGTFVNGRRLEAGASQPLEDGDVLSMGMVRLVYREQ